MDLLPLILTFIGAYGVFLVLAYVLARVFFPTMDVDDEENTAKRSRERHHKRLASR
ncbi:MAG TPA: hypothetical protein VD884_17175 [Ohtaekwangia sp.]|nr:hypothetical protein [Ohtaekwangia sp.]